MNDVILCCILRSSFVLKVKDFTMTSYTYYKTYNFAFISIFLRVQNSQYIYTVQYIVNVLCRIVTYQQGQFGC